MIRGNYWWKTALTKNVKKSNSYKWIRKKTLRQKVCEKYIMEHSKRVIQQLGNCMQIWMDLLIKRRMHFKISNLSRTSLLSVRGADTLATWQIVMEQFCTGVMTPAVRLWRLSHPPDRGRRTSCPFFDPMVPQNCTGSNELATLLFLTLFPGYSTDIMQTTHTTIIKMAVNFLRTDQLSVTLAILF